MPSPHSESGSDGEAPEAFAASETRKSAKGRENALAEFHASQKLQRKAINRERDRKLKERSAATAGDLNKRKAGRSEVKRRRMDNEDEDHDGADIPDAEPDEDDYAGAEDDVMARMRRAMQEADDENDEDRDEDEDEDEGSEGTGDSGEEGAEEGVERLDEDGEDQSSLADELDERDDDDSENETDEAQPSIPRHLSEEDDPSGLPRYLPDALFASSSRPRQKAPPSTPQPDSRQLKKRKRPSAQPKQKDIVLGTRTIRTLPSVGSNTPVTARGALPSAKAKKFVDRALNLKRKGAAASQSKGWERRSGTLLV
jgi:hypothetical protein